MAEKSIGRAEKVIFLPLNAPQQRRILAWCCETHPRFIVAISPILCHKPTLHRPADQGLPCRCPCRLVPLRQIIEHFQRSNEHFSRSNAFAGGSCCGIQESQMPKLKTKSGAKKRFKVTATGKVMAAQRGKRHGMIKRTKKQIRQLRGTRVLFKTDGDNIKKYFLPNA
jgi:large subunit ribosomal protein L35